MWHNSYREHQKTSYLIHLKSTLLRKSTVDSLLEQEGSKLDLIIFGLSIPPFLQETDGWWKWRRNFRRKLMENEIEELAFLSNLISKMRPFQHQHCIIWKLAQGSSLVAGSR